MSWKKNNRLSVVDNAQATLNLYNIMWLTKVQELLRLFVDGPKLTNIVTV